MTQFLSRSKDFISLPSPQYQWSEYIIEAVIRQVGSVLSLHTWSQTTDNPLHFGRTTPKLQPLFFLSTKSTWGVPLQAKAKEFHAKAKGLLEQEIEDRNDEVGLKIMAFTLAKYINGSEYMK